MSCTIREATSEDIDVVLHMAREWVSEEISWGQQAIACDYLKARIGKHFLVAEYETGIVGYAIGEIMASPMAVFRDNLYMKIEELYVVPTKRECGIGGDLLKALMKSAEFIGVHQFYVFSATKDQDRIITFYERYGFRTWGTQFYRIS